jgi:Rieske Fe-S protein
MSPAPLSRRSVLNGGVVLVVAGVAGFVVARRTDAAKGQPGVANAYGAPEPDVGRPLTALDSVPAGGGLVLAGRGIVLTRDDAGVVRAFSAICTHQGCTVNEVDRGEIACPCHGSRFDATTGDVVQGPATTGLRAVSVVVRGDQVFPG